MRVVFLFCLSILFFSCKDNPHYLKEGVWRATLDIREGEKLPFIFVANTDGTLVVHNAEERIVVDEITIYGDSVKIQMPVYEGYFLGRFGKSANQITGEFIKPSLARVVPFTMTLGDKQARFEQWSKGPGIHSVTGRWETVFSPDSEKDRYEAMGIFDQIGMKVTGTFRTTTGDYRYLEGSRNGKELWLSTFDGAHAFLFKGIVSKDSINGVFYSGNHWKEPFKAKRNSAYTLPDATDLTFIKEGYDGLEFSFPDENGNSISLTDERFKNKVVIVQIMGSWCPNCLEETRYYVDYLKENPSSQLEIVGLAFEYAPTKEKAFASIKRLKDRLEVPYPILLAQYGTEDKKLANEKLPMLNHILSYPTTIYIDKKGDVRRIHTGFNGKATGNKYLEYTKDFETFVSDLLRE